MSASTSPVSVVGLGIMGTALAAAFLKAGHPTTVWNRSAAKTGPLVAQGALPARSAGRPVPRRRHHGRAADDRGPPCVRLLQRRDAGLRDPPARPRERHQVPGGPGPAIEQGHAADGLSRIADLLKK
ncbi:hypothetical protein SLUN_22845 [Streptomyces lunaelactis]|uniref:6-phosphogluconate dehydrogenase NADP-binding domain-containing protein n=1 Tax=Streptomyces lunaelactis TaxID=1535768 RepID=A0A2R4T674_9ACTN|nr:hypothetical protein SLUN_22845 [Streptomyces lunaelactis]